MDRALRFLRCTVILSSDLGSMIRFLRWPKFHGSSCLATQSAELQIELQDCRGESKVEVTVIKLNCRGQIEIAVVKLKLP